MEIWKRLYTRSGRIIRYRGCRSLTRMQMFDASPVACISLSQMLGEATARLRGAGIQSAEPEAVWLMEKALHLTSLDVIIDRDRILPPKECAAAAAFINRR